MVEPSHLDGHPLIIGVLAAPYTITELTFSSINQTD